MASRSSRVKGLICSRSVSKTGICIRGCFLYTLLTLPLHLCQSWYLPRSYLGGVG